MKILIYGIGGKMGKTLYSALQNNNNATAVAGVDKFAQSEQFDIPVFKDIRDVMIDFDCIIDFSVKEAVFDILPYAMEKSIPVVLATTGYDEKEKALIDKASAHIAIFHSGNMSLGVNVISKLVEKTAAILGNNADVEIIESHHNQKIDSPSGTALMLLNAVQNARVDTHPIFGRHGIIGKRDKKEVGVHAVRGGTIVGTHEVMFILDNEVITIKHQAESKTIFANGSINAAIYIKDKPAGLYNMNDLLA